MESVEIKFKLPKSILVLMGGMGTGVEQSVMETIAVDLYRRRAAPSRNCPCGSWYPCNSGNCRRQDFGLKSQPGALRRAGPAGGADDRPANSRGDLHGALTCARSSDRAYGAAFRARELSS